MYKVAQTVLLSFELVNDSLAIRLVGADERLSASVTRSSATGFLCTTRRDTTPLAANDRRRPLDDLTDAWTTTTSKSQFSPTGYAVKISHQGGNIR